MSTVAVLYVEPTGHYSSLPDVDCWDERRDARLYNGPHPVIAHPPCQRWGKMYAGSPSVIKKTGVRKKLGDDDGCFIAALTAVRRWGGVLEHPWLSKAWPCHGLRVPDRRGGWVRADNLGGWTCCVEQRGYGHYAAKPTLLYAFGTDLPDLLWGKSDPVFPQWAIAKYGLARCKRYGEVSFQGGGHNRAKRNITPAPFCDVLLGMARSVGVNQTV